MTALKTEQLTELQTGQGTRCRLESVLTCLSLAGPDRLPVPSAQRLRSFLSSVDEGGLAAGGLTTEVLVSIFADAAAESGKFRTIVRPKISAAESLLHLYTG